MCGIIGATHRAQPDITAALNTFAYRGPDASGYFADERVALGHARLSIIDLDERSNQPFFDEKKELAITYNGEIYNYTELRRELEAERGIRFRTASDTEVLVEGYRAWGIALLPKLRGMFAFGIYDKRDGSIFLARDHAGIKPLYYSLGSGQLGFASELKGVVALLSQAGRKIEIDETAIARYPVFGYIPSPLTPVRGVRKLERGSWLRYEIANAAVTGGRWQPRVREISTRAELEEAVKRSIIEHCVADVPVGTFFSGGIDSSLITAVLHEAGMDLAAFSIRVSGRDEDEPYFRAIAQRLGVKAQVADFGIKEFESLYEPVFSRMDDPIADPSIFPTALVSRIAAREVKAVLSGEGGDELFLGYPRISQLARMGHFGQGAAGIYAAAFTDSPSFRGKNRLFSAAAKGAGIPAAYYLSQVSPARDRVPFGTWLAAERRVSSGDPLWYDRDWYLENMLLRKADMATSFASIEGRVPLLGAELWDAAPRFARENLEGERTKAVLKDMLARYLPRELIERPKSGFGIDLATVFRESQSLREDLPHAFRMADGLNLGIGFRDQGTIVSRYPVLAFGLVALYRSLKNLTLA